MVGMQEPIEAVRGSALFLTLILRNSSRSTYMSSGSSLSCACTPPTQSTRTGDDRQQQAIAVHHGISARTLEEPHRHATLLVAQTVDAEDMAELLWPAPLRSVQQECERISGLDWERGAAHSSRLVSS